jgi:23S rRNA (cytidine1920-2'-O)/16S rRNA (cytidine1409-2'-O)-methyltransferase
VGGQVAAKPATMVDDAAAVLVEDDVDDPGYASRGGWKLDGALDRLGGPSIEGRFCLDAGASTGGFTDVLLRRGARAVTSVDVGYGLLDWRLQTDERVTVIDRTNVRLLQPGDLPYAPEVIVADLSFISLRLVLPALVACAAEGADLVPMVKPQFEVGRDAVGAGGVVRDPEQRAEVVRRIASAAYDLGWGTQGVAASPLPGPSGNVEFFLWLRRDAGAPDPERIGHVVEAGHDV